MTNINIHTDYSRGYQNGYREGYAKAYEEFKNILNNKMPSFVIQVNDREDAENLIKGITNEKS